MKTLFVSLVTFLFALIIGCQESSITDPVSNDTEFNQGTAVLNAMDKDNYHEVIYLQGMLQDPSHFFNSFAEIKGTVRYRLEKIITDQRPPWEAIKVQLKVNALLKGGCPGHKGPWTVDNNSVDMVYKSPENESVYYLEKSFRVCNTCCAPLNLVLKFQVDEKKLSLVSMALELVPGWLPIPDPEM
jgi:hypothetical protein